MRYGVGSEDTWDLSCVWTERGGLGVKMIVFRRQLPASPIGDYVTTDVE